MTTPSDFAPHAIRAVGKLPKPDYKVGVHFFPDLGLIVKAPTGVVYTNQCAGYMCAHCEAEGFFVPLQARGGWRALDVLQNLFSGNGFDDFTPKTADQFDRVLHRLGLDSIRSDRSKLEESAEAWVHVIASGGDDFYIPFDSRTRESVEGVLVWPNRD